MLKPKMKQTIFAASFFLWSILIIFFSVMPGEDLVKLGNEDSGFRWDYLEHFAVFSLFSILFLLWLRNRPAKKVFIALLIVGISFASFTELLQLFIESRSFNYIDILFNIAGLHTGYFIIKAVQRFLPKSAI